LSRLSISLNVSTYRKTWGELTELHRCPKNNPAMAHGAINFSNTYPDFYSYFLIPHHTTHPSKTPSQHPEFRLPHWDLSNMSFLRHAKHAHQEHNVPDADMRETRTAYYLDIELPGVGDKNSISIAWMSPRLLVVEGLIGRLEVEGKLDGDVNGAQANGSHANGDSGLQQGTKGSQMAADPKSETQPWHEVIALNERRIGAYSRHFTFACDVDNKALRAKLRDGLLSIAVPKVEHNIEFGEKLAID
jgi:HSP20 family molecular chaperone IbpA